jgi:DNA invertase Pin-like site-specific DNA recombinase
MTFGCTFGRALRGGQTLVRVWDIASGKELWQEGVMGFRESALAYIKSQASQGWTCIKAPYDDGGFTGGNMERPALQRLLADIQAGKIDCVVVYKVDRLSRSLLDFARMMETFERHQVAFVSVTQQFNTAHSMGRLVLNVLLSFAQFEREIISERTRDKIAAARRKGKWSGGLPLLGYDVDPLSFLGLAISFSPASVTLLESRKRNVRFSRLAISFSPAYVNSTLSTSMFRFLSLAISFTPASVTLVDSSQRAVRFSGGVSRSAPATWRAGFSQAWR